MPYDFYNPTQPNKGPYHTHYSQHVDAGLLQSLLHKHGRFLPCHCSQSLCLPLTSNQLSGGDRKHAEKGVGLRSGRGKYGARWRGVNVERAIRESKEEEERKRRARKQQRDIEG